MKTKKWGSTLKVDMLDRVLLGIEAAKQAGLQPIKINAVIVQGNSEDEVADFAALARAFCEDALH